MALQKNESALVRCMPTKGSSRALVATGGHCQCVHRDQQKSDLRNTSGVLEGVPHDGATGCAHGLQPLTQPVSRRKKKKNVPFRASKVWDGVQRLGFELAFFT